MVDNAPPAVPRPQPDVARPRPGEPEPGAAAEQLAPAVTVQVNFADASLPYQVEVRVLNRSAIVDRFEITALPGSVPVAPQATSVHIFPSSDAVQTFTVTPVPLPPFGKQSIPHEVVFRVRAEVGGGVTYARILASGMTPPVFIPGAAEPAAAAPAWRLLSDHPVRPDADVLGFADTARRMAGIILDARAATPFTIGIQGGWGAGKSSLMRMIRQEIESDPSAQRGLTRVAWFNAWTAEGSSALTALIRSVLQELDPSVLRRLLRRTRRSSWLLAPFMIAATWLGIGRLADELWTRFSVDPAQRNEISKELQRALTDWADRDRPVNHRRMLVVFVDDLDRCSPENIRQVLDAIRLYLDAPGLVFVIGYDHAVVVDALSRTHGASAGPRSRTYLEKIIQVDHVLPLPDPGQARDMALACARHCGVADILGTAELNLIVERTDRNPRRLKRFLNTFVLARQLDGSSSRLRPSEHIKMLLLRMYFPDLFRVVLLEPERDVLGQLVELVRYRAAITAGQEPDAERVDWLFQTSGVAPPRPGEERAAALARLESHLPAAVVELSRDTDLFSLAWSLGTAAQRHDLLERVRIQLPPPALPPVGAVPPVTPVPPVGAVLPGAAPPSGGSGTAPAAPAVEHRSADQDLTCPECGLRVAADGQHFCPRCGAYLRR
ncbi:P-loop NTPase fold protein [Plantactinospora siamensis]|uniref:P-loop NTPase fold protein n=1 Tax=Plantactinospora siamensis TaxID=555372 RepID=A0ABV6P3T0_9ACTN